MIHMNLERQQLEENEAEKGEENEEEKVINKHKEIGGSMIPTILLLFHFIHRLVQLLKSRHQSTHSTFSLSLSVCVCL